MRRNPLIWLGAFCYLATNMKKVLLSLTVAGLLSLTPFISHADPYVGAYYAKVIQAPVSGCSYGVLYDNNYGYDLVSDYFNDISAGDYLYGKIQLGPQFMYDAASKKPLTFYVENTMMSWNMVVNSYFTYCPTYNY